MTDLNREYALIDDCGEIAYSNGLRRELRSTDKDWLTDLNEAVFDDYFQLVEITQEH